MKQRFKKIYVEITNNCNLNCSFCSKISKIKKEMSEEEFETIIKKIKDYTKYISIINNSKIKGKINTNSQIVNKKFKVV